jgi:integrase/recombinase XerD
LAGSAAAGLARRSIRKRSKVTVCAEDFACPAKAGGKKDRYVILSPNLLELLRDWWRVARKKGWMHPSQPWLFPGYRGQHMSGRQLHRLVRLAAARAGITKRVGVHTLRHSFATHLLEQKTDIRIIQSPAPAKAGVLLGHKKLDTTALYTRVAVSAIGQVTSPLDVLLKMPG